MRLPNQSVSIRRCSPIRSTGVAGSEATVNGSAGMIATALSRVATGRVPTSILQRSVCSRAQNQRVVRRSLDILDFTIALDGGSAENGASACAATAKADCNSQLEDVGSLEYEDGVCVWVCKDFHTP